MSGKINERSFSKDDILSSGFNDSPDTFIKKMNQTIYKKKHNYKNIPELDNIYDKPIWTDTFTENYTSMDNSDKPNSSSALNKKESLKNKLPNTIVSTLEEPESSVVNEEFKQADDDRIYIPDYEYDTSQTDNNGSNGNKSQADNNAALGNILSSKGYDWENIPAPKENKKKCGPDRPDCGESDTDITYYINKLKEYIKIALGYYPWFLKMIATNLYRSIDGLIDKTPSDDQTNSTMDIELLTNILHYIFMASVSWFCAYNWYYITFYKNIPNNAKPHEYRSIIQLYIKRVSFIKSLVQVMLFVHTYLIQRFIVNSWFKIFNIFNYFYLFFICDFFTNPMVILLIMMIVFLYINCVYSTYFVDTFISFMDDTNFPFQRYIYTLVVFDICIGLSPVSYIERFIQMVKTYFSPITTSAGIIGGMVTSLVLIRLSGIFLMVHMFIMSIFSSTIFSESHNPIKTISEIQNTIYNQSDDVEECQDTSNITGYASLILQFIVENALYILHIAVFIYSLYTLNKNIISVSVKILLTMILVFLIFICFLAIWYTNVISKQRVNPNEVILNRSTDN